MNPSLHVTGFASKISCLHSNHDLRGTATETANEIRNEGNNQKGKGG